MDVQLLPGEVLERIIGGIRSFLGYQCYIRPEYRAESLRRALSRDNFFSFDLLQEILPRRGQRSNLAYLRLHGEFEQAFGQYIK